MVSVIYIFIFIPKIIFQKKAKSLLNFTFFSVLVTLSMMKYQSWHLYTNAVCKLYITYQLLQTTYLHHQFYNARYRYIFTQFEFSF